jgi:hypothetical protein
MNDYNNLIQKFPLLFEGISEQEPFSHFGFECDIGWYDIIRNACYALYNDYRNQKYHYDYAQKCLDNFASYLANRRSYDKDTPEEDFRKALEYDKSTYLQKMEEAKQKLPKVAQIKEKFGTLRFYIDNGNEVSNAIVHYAELMSEVTCEVCGNAGRTYEMGWHKTLCREHAIQRYGLEKVEKYENKD